MSDGSITIEGDRPTIRLERHLVDPPTTVWAALTEREQLRRWFPCDVVVEGGEWIVGQSLTFQFPPEVIDLTLHGVVLDVVETQRLAFTWGDEVLRFELSPEGSGTRLVLFNELDRPHAARNAAGWDDCLDQLSGDGPPTSSWRTRFERYVTRFESLAGPQDGPPDGYKGD